MVLSEESIGKKEGFFSAALNRNVSSFYEIMRQISANRYVLTTARFSFTICCIYHPVVKNKIPTDLNPFK